MVRRSSSQMIPYAISAVRIASAMRDPRMERMAESTLSSGMQCVKMKVRHSSNLLPRRAMRFSSSVSYLNTGSMKFFSLADDFQFFSASSRLVGTHIATGFMVMAISARHVATMRICAAFVYNNVHIPPFQRTISGQGARFNNYDIIV